jgi:hypothetical protein
MSTGSDAIGVTTNKSNRPVTGGSAKGANKSGVSTGGGAIDPPIYNAAPPTPASFAEAKAIAAADRRYREDPR